MAKKVKPTYQIAVGLKKGHKVTKNERKKPRPSTLKGVSTLAMLLNLWSKFSLHKLTNIALLSKQLCRCREKRHTQNSFEA